MVSDLSGITVDSESAAGSEFIPQFCLMDYVPSTNWKQYVKSVVNESLFGDVEVVRYGQVQFTAFKIMYQTNEPAPGGQIETDVAGVENLTAFLDFATTKGLVEFMYDRDDLGTFESIRLKSSADSEKGTGYRLRELYDVGLPRYYETSVMVWRLTV